MVKHELTDWGLNIDVAALIMVAAFTALYFVLSQVSFPIGPTTFITFGEIFMWLGAAIYGPVWAALIGSVGIIYLAVIVFGSPLTVFGLTIEGFLAGLLMKKLPLTGSALIAQIAATPYWYWLLDIVSGYGAELTWFIIAKGVVNQAFNAVVASLILAIPGITNYLPITFDSKPVRDVLA